MRSPVRILGLFFLVLSITALVILVLFARIHTTSPRISGIYKPEVTKITSELMESLKNNATNPRANNGIGGVWVNWKHGTSPLQTNFNSSGNPDDENVPMRHETLHDVYYFETLLLYNKQHPRDSRYKEEEKRYATIVKKVLQKNIPKDYGMYALLIRLHKYTNDEFYKQKAIDLVTSFEKHIDPKVHIPYQSDQHHPYGYYYVDQVMDEGLALIMAGTQFRKNSWIEKGKEVVSFVYEHAYDKTHSTFPEAMDTVVTPKGAVNPSETIYTDADTPQRVSIASLSHIIRALVQTYSLTKDADYLRKAEILAKQVGANNHLPLQFLWDAEYGGYVQDALYSKKNIKQHKTTKILKDQIAMLEVFYLLNRYTNNTYKEQEEALLDKLSAMYYQPGHGVLAEMSRDWKPIKTDGYEQTWIDAESTILFAKILITLNETEIFSLAFSPTPTPTFTPTPSPKPTLTFTPTPSPKPTFTPTPTPKPTLTPRPNIRANDDLPLQITATPSATLTPTPTIQCIPTPACAVKAPKCIIPIPTGRWCR